MSVSVFEATSAYTSDLYTDQFTACFPFPLSPFQQWAIHGYLDGAHVLVTAHTGSGKTVPAEFILQHAVRTLKKRVLYTSPIKALSNQKFHEFHRKYPDLSFGILTGDMKFNPNADVLILTTEVLRNALYHGTIRDSTTGLDIRIDFNDVDAVIFDEVHYINDADRGHVWEETIMLLPTHIRLLMLSATLGNTRAFAEWIASVKEKPVYVCPTTHRVVPLKHMLFTTFSQGSIQKKSTDTTAESTKPNSHSRAPIQTHDPDRLLRIHRQLLLLSDPGTPFHDSNYQYVRGLQQKHESVFANGNAYNELVEFLVEKKMTPALVFALSRKRCEQLATQRITSSLLTPQESTEVQRILDRELRTSPHYETYVSMRSFQELSACAMRGVAYHHSGMLPLFKELVEILFEKGYIKVLFATETFAVGVNMPTKTVVFSELEKMSEQGKRMLYSHEYLQMAGRAGRRGLDTIGYVIVLGNTISLPPTETMKELIGGNAQCIESKCHPSYDIVLKALSLSKDPHELLCRSLLSATRHKQVAEYQRLLHAYSQEETARTTTLLTPELQEACQKYIEYTTGTGTQGTMGFVAKGNQANQERKRQQQWIQQFERTTPDYNDVLQEYTQMKAHEDTIHELTVSMRQLETELQDDIQRYIHLLTEWEYIVEGGEGSPYQLGKKGHVATFFHENPVILMTEMLWDTTLSSTVCGGATSTHSDEADTDNSLYVLGGFLVLFSGSKPRDGLRASTNASTVRQVSRHGAKEVAYESFLSTSTHDAHGRSRVSSAVITASRRVGSLWAIAKEWNDELLRAEQHAGMTHLSQEIPQNVWEESSDQITQRALPMLEWLQGTSSYETIVGTYGLFEGNFIKDCLKVYSMCAELESACELLEQYELQGTCKRLRDRVVREIVNADSLYLH